MGRRAVSRLPGGDAASTGSHPEAVGVQAEGADRPCQPGHAPRVQSDRLAGRQPLPAHVQLLQGGERPQAGRQGGKAVAGEV